MRLEVASAFVLPLSQTKWRTVGDAGATSDGLLYLDWLSGRQDIAFDLESAVDIYLAHPCNRQALKEALGEEG